MRGDRPMAQSTNCVCCSSSVSRDWRAVPQPGLGLSEPHGSMSASGQLPGLACGDHLARLSNAVTTPFGKSSPGLVGVKLHPSQMSLEIRHICEYSATSAACDNCVGPGDRLSTIGRPLCLIAVAI